MTTLAPDAGTLARRAMIDSQLRVSGVNDPAVLGAMDTVAREDFVPEAWRASAYLDRALPLGESRALAAPLVHGRMLTEAALRAGEKVLVIAHSGYLAALASALGASVTGALPGAKIPAGPFDAILIDGAAEVLPAGLAKALAAGGRVVTGTVARGVTRLALGKAAGGEVALLPLAEIGMPVLSEYAAPKRWSF